MLQNVVMFICELASAPMCFMSADFITMYNWLLILPCRSILTYSRIGGHIKTVTFCQGSHYLAVASDNGNVQLLGIEASKPPKSPKIHPLQSRYV